MQHPEYILFTYTFVHVETDLIIDKAAFVVTLKKELNFVQHILTAKVRRQVEVVVPENVFLKGWDHGRFVRSCWKQQMFISSFLFPAGIFYASGVKANVVFVNNSPSSKDL